MDLSNDNLSKNNLYKYFESYQNKIIALYNKKILEEPQYIENEVRKENFLYRIIKRLTFTQLVNNSNFIIINTISHFTPDEIELIFNKYYSDLIFRPLEAYKNGIPVDVICAHAYMINYFNPSPKKENLKRRLIEVRDLLYKEKLITI